MFLLRALCALLIVVLLLSLGGYFSYQKMLADHLELPHEGVTLDIQKGQSLNSVLTLLKQQGVLTSLWPAKVYAKLNNLGGQIKAGEFHLTSPLTLPSLFNYISENNQVTYSVQFIEGLSYKDALSVLVKHEKITQSLKGVSDNELIKLLHLKDATHLEGLFYPDTYNFHKGDSDLTILKRANQRLNSILDDAWQQRQKGLPLESAYEALILASIIEKETGVPEERPEISGVFVRRLKQKMRLQTDPTVIYGLGDRYQGNITRKHLQQVTPYNTYRISGLPPTPIALVGRAAIHAALNPKAGKSLYFVAKGDGAHYFSETIQEHNKAVRKYQLKRRSDYRSSAQ